MSADGPWLTDDQQRVWRRWLTVSAQLPTALHRRLQVDSHLSLPDFEVLVHLSDSHDGRVRVSDLARTLTWERSRLSHHVTRMQARGLVVRQECLDDGRGAYVGLTDAGRTALTTAAPTHAGTVRDLVFDALTPEELEALGSALTKVLDRLGEPVTLSR